MNDNQILYFSSAFCLVLILVSFRFRKQFATLNLVLFFSYNVILYYNLFYKGEAGASFLWWFYLIILTIVQALIVIIFLLFNFLKK
jgi:hypothetical protein